MLSLGQVGVVEPGTLTCRYHGMTFDGRGECIAYIADGPDSAACGKIRARTYPTEEHSGIIWAYMGDNDPLPLLDAQPHARDVLEQKSLLIQQVDLPYSHLNMLDNTVDMTHVGVLHRTCLLFAGQKPFGELGYDNIDGHGIRAFYKEPGEHPGQMNIDSVEWYLPKLVYHGPGEAGPSGAGWFWFVPRDVGSFTGWFIVGRPEIRGGAAVEALVAAAIDLFFGRFLGTLRPWSGSGVWCLLAGDAPMQTSQGRVVRWGEGERLARGDRPVVKARQMLRAAHAAEVEQRRARSRERPGGRRGTRDTATASPSSAPG